MGILRALLWMAPIFVWWSPLAIADPPKLLAQIEIGGPDSYAAFPSLYRAVSGELVVTVTARVRRSHHDDSGAGMVRESTDCGQTWQTVSVAKPAAVFADERDQSRLTVLTARSWRALPQGEPSPAEAETWREGGKTFVAQGVVERFSEDGGRRWVERPIPFGAHSMLMNYNAASHLKTTRNTRLSALYVKYRRGDSSQVIIARRAANDTHWKFVRLPSLGNSSLGLNETALIELPQGRVLALSRVEPDSVGEIYMSLSTDDGLTWSRPERSGIRGYPASAALFMGDLVVTVADRRSRPMTIDAYILGVDDLAIRRKLALFSTPSGNAPDFGYPLTVACGDSLVTAFYAPRNAGSAISKVLTWRP